MSTVRSLTALVRMAPLARRLSLALLATTVLLAVLVSPALAAAPWWAVYSEVSPTNLAPGTEGQIVVVVSNLGDAAVNTSKTPVTITDTLPKGLKAIALTGQAIRKPAEGFGAEVQCPAGVPTAPFTCTAAAGTLYPYEQLAFTIRVKVEEPPSTEASLPEEVTVEGGVAARVSSIQHVRVSEAATPFGVGSYELGPFNENGTPATQAGSHPFALTTALVMNQSTGRQPVALPKDLRFNLPPGLVGNPNAAAQCSETDFASLVDETNLCPPASVIGVATVTAYEPISGILTRTVPVFNLVPAQGEPARFGLEIVGKIPIIIDASVRSGRDYGVVASVADATQTGGLLSSVVTLWGVPGDARHDNTRDWECVAGGEYHKAVGRPCPASSEVPLQPFLTLPTSCAADPASEPLSSTVEAESWADPGSLLTSEYTWLGPTGQPLGFDGCNELPFTPELDVRPEVDTASTPTGLQVDVKVPQTTTLEANGLAEANIRDTTVTLPEGVQLNPAAANGLLACSETEIGFEGFDEATQTDDFSTTKPSCPEASKLGTVHIKTPLLSHELEGAVYLASPAPNGEARQNPFNSLVALYLVAEDPVSGVLVKLAGKGELNEHTLRVATTFTNAPQVPFEDLKIELLGGPRASASTPAHCGAYPAEAAFTPWSGTGNVDLFSPAGEFSITSGVGGGGCPGSPLGFSPGFDAQSTNATAGAFTSFALELSRPDGDQTLSAVSMHLPPGNAAVLSSVTLCDEAQANADACPPESQVGEATAVAGVGSEPYVEGGGKVFITGPYGGAPFGLEIVTPAVAGPFNLGTVTVRSKLFINPENASVTIVSDPLPTQLRGIPLQLKRVLVSVNRPGFEFNPTNCSPMSIEGSVSGSEGASASVSSPFDVTGCQNLPFAPKLTAVAGGHGSKADGTSLAVTVTSGGVGSSGVAQAGIAKVDLALPVALSSRLSTLQKACTEATFNANPASCNEDSVIGYATIHTPVLSNPLSGPAYLVSHGGAAFPDVEFVLQGEGITLLLDGKTDIKAGVTYSRFESAPDAPFTVFETVLPAGPHGVLTPNVPEREEYSLCKAGLQMPTEITGQNGAILNQSTNIAVTGCAGVKDSKTVKLTRAQLLVKALKACKRYKKKARRVACEKQARKKYFAKRASAKKADHKTSKTTRRH